MRPAGKLQDTFKVQEPLQEGQFRLGYFPFLDGMRGIFMLAIMFFHSGAPILTGTFISLNTFFVLSGFLITSLLIKEWDRYGQISLKNFYLRRALRLLPALFAILIVYNIICYLFLKNPLDHLEDSLLVLFYASNWTRAFDYDRPLILGHAWSLSVEEQFYILWPLVLIIMLRYVKTRSSIVTIVSVGILTLLLHRIYMQYSGASVERIYNGSDTRGDSLLIGCALGIILSSNLLPKSKNLPTMMRYASVVAASGIAVICIAANWRHPSTYYFVLSLVDIFSVLMILGLILSQGGIVRKVLELPFLVWTGKISYGIYLWHFPIFHFLYARLGLPWYLIVTVGCVLTFAVATVSYYLLEQPFLRLKTRLN